MSTVTLEGIIREEVRKVNLYPTLEDKCVNKILNLVAQCSKPIDYAHIALLCLAIKTSMEKTLILEKRGCAFWDNCNERKK